MNQSRTMTASLHQILREGTARAGVELAERHAQDVLNYLKLLIKWNKRVNLTATRSERDLLELHVLDSVAILPHVPANASRMIDVGSGAGFTAVVAAIFRPALAVTALEPTHKKHAFLSAVKRELPLPNLTPTATRLEDHLRGADFRPYHVAVSRATWPLLDWLERGAELVRPHGIVLGMEGAETHPLPAGAKRHVYTLVDRTRAIVAYRPRETE